MLITAVCALLVGLVGLRNRPLGAVGIAAFGPVGAPADRPSGPGRTQTRPGTRR